MPRFQIRVRERYKLLALFFMGVIASAFFIRYAGLSMEEEIASGGLAFFRELAGEETDGRELFFKLLWSRGWLPVLWIGLSFTALGLAALYFFWVFLGFSLTTALWEVMVFGGWRGPFYFWGLLFPQYLFYGPALLLLYASCLHWNRFWRVRRAPIRRVPVGSPQLKRFLARNLLGLGLLLAGVFVESQWNPWILKKMFIKM